MKEKSLTELNFDQAMELARTDPEAFEQYRRDVIEALIARAPERNRQHLRRVQWRIEQERKRASNPLSACVKLYRMMWESFAGECGLIDVMCNARSSTHSMDGLRPKAKVVSLSRDAATESPSES
jgi:hypothetical protein